MPEISTPAQVMAVRGSDINALVARQQYEQNVQQYQQQQLQLQQQQAMQDQRRQQLVNEVNYLSSVRRRVLDVSDKGKVNEYLQGKGYTPDEIKFITSYYERGGRVSGASRAEQQQIATYGILRGGGLSKAETKEVLSSGTITYEQAKKLTPATRSALGVDYFYSQQERLRAEQARAKAEEEKPSLSPTPSEIPASLPTSISAKPDVVYGNVPSKTSLFFDYVSKKGQAVINWFGTEAEGILSLGGYLNRPIKLGYGELVGTPSKTGMKGTMEYEIKAVTPEQKFQKGEITEEQYIQQATKAEVASTALKSGVLGAISVLAPPIGLGLAASTTAKAAITPETYTLIRVAPLQVGENVLAGAAGAAAGGLLTAGAISGIKSILTPIGKEYIPLEKITTPEVASGAKKFPEVPKGTSASTRLQIFKSNPYPLPGETQTGVYHATPFTFGKETVTVPGTSEVPGLYVSPAASTYFLKIGMDEFRPFGLSMQSVLEKSPTILRIYPREIVPYSSNIQPGYAGVLNIKPEIEAVIPPSTQLSQVANQFYTTVQGRNIPIPQYTVSGQGITTLGELSAGYAPTPVISPSYAGSSLSYAPYFSIKPSSSISVPSYKSSSYELPIPSASSSAPISRAPISIIAPSYISSSSPQISSVTSPISIPSISAPPSFTPPSPSVSYSGIQRLNYPMTSQIKSGSLLKKLKRGIMESRGYKTFVIRKGKKVYLPGVALRGEAIRKGEIKATTTLAATFGVEPTNIGIPGIESSYQPSPKVFRGYRIKGTAKIPLKDTWIQKAGTRKEPTIKGGRLSARSEIAELVSLRRRKSKRGGFFR